MKKLVLILIAVFSLVSIANSQNIFVKHDKVVNVGVGMIKNLHVGKNNNGSDFIPHITTSFEYCIADSLFDEKSSIGVGGYFGYATYKKEHTGTAHNQSSVNTRSFIFGGRGTIHYQFINRLDTYAGLVIGYNKVIDNREMSRSSVKARGWSLFVGAKYYIINNVAITCELGYGISVLDLGVTLKF